MPLNLEEFRRTNFFMSGEALGKSISESWLYQPSQVHVHDTHVTTLAIESWQSPEKLAEGSAFTPQVWSYNPNRHPFPINYGAILKERNEQDQIGFTCLPYLNGQTDQQGDELGPWAQGCLDAHAFNRLRSFFLIACGKLCPGHDPSKIQMILANDLTGPLKLPVKLYILLKPQDWLAGYRMQDADVLIKLLGNDMPVEDMSWNTTLTWH